MTMIADLWDAISLATVWQYGFLATFFVMGTVLLVWLAKKLRLWTQEFIDGKDPSSYDESILQLFKFRVNMDPIGPWQIIFDFVMGMIAIAFAALIWPISNPYFLFLYHINKQRRMTLVAKKLAED